MLYSLNISILSKGVLFLSFILILSQSQLSALAQNSNSSQNIPNSIYIPATISREAQDVLKNLTMSASTLVTPSPDDIKGWQNLNQQISSMLIGMSKPLVDIYQPNITAAKLGNVTVTGYQTKRLEGQWQSFGLSTRGRPYLSGC